MRPYNGGFQIISGHCRTKAAVRAGLKQILAWVREMEDETAFMQLVLSNAQGELTPLERGMHALAATEKGKHGRSIKTYAAQIGRPERTVYNEVQAAEVVKVCPQGQISILINRTKHLSEIHGAAQRCWPALVERLVDNEWTVEQTSAAVKAVTTAKPPRGYEKLFAIEKLQEMAAAGQNPEETTRLCVRAIERGRADIRDVQFAVEEYSARFEAWLVDHAWDADAITTTVQALLKEQRAVREEADAKAMKLKRAITLAEWNTLTSAEKGAACRVKNPEAHLNPQENAAIEWARWSWNPVTGCLHNCPYCYARDIALEIYPQKFDPSFVPDALTAPLNGKPPKEARESVAFKNIFTCSMADLFGNWVPREWIDAVIGVAREASQWNFLFLTKFPQRLAEFEFPENAWIGTTVDCQARAANAERAFRQVKAGVKWLSLEPLIEPVEIDFGIFQWVVIGGASESTQTPEWKPPRKWVTALTYKAELAGCAVYHKTNLNLERLRSYPGFEDQEPVAAPSPFHYLKESGSGH